MAVRTFLVSTSVPRAPMAARTLWVSAGSVNETYAPTWLTRSNVDKHETTRKRCDVLTRLIPGQPPTLHGYTEVLPGQKTSEEAPYAARNRDIGQAQGQNTLERDRNR